MLAPEQISNEERAIIVAFARNLQSGGSGMLSIAQLTDLQPDRREELWKALWQLSDRGWLVVNSSLQWKPHHECTLVGEGLRVAKGMPLDDADGSG